ncbi:Phosphoheptose isomerase [bioreactor metagenome]|jgi:D-sedoheptulose 7-phosphate isomerase|uniref:D-sedoheptulose-7-phosphate isomerase n=1 Tax=bioreactor metagenome TaxID=1076179 RepID=A0A644UF19_9ZZZZ|nr:D-sedoheptulose 7-phosphate isomerase [Bacteroidales bacterium]MDY4789594.1 D-sedoheptulose 7-phosphate isomerase [Bacteroidales bacterium]MEA4966512.1 D-sedoheptulose 7-phosphate isomerase [Bacteroidaceae bacterium]MEA5099206.1 D-sedoheptulose 7-phosphate isomerase [Bacteroidales bacterium]
MTRIKQVIEESVSLKTLLLKDEAFLNEIEKVKDVMVKALNDGKKILWCGNGGSAADSQHLAAEFSGRFYYDRPPLRSEALHVNTSYLTAVANDYSYDVIYSRMVKAMGDKGDVLVGISTSGNSKNIVLAFEQAKENGMISIGFTGNGGGKMKEKADYILDIPSKDTPRVQECHIMVGHILCELVEAEIFPR